MLRAVLRDLMRPLLRNTRRMLRSPLAVLPMLTWLLLAQGCLSAAPSLSGGATTPMRRVDVALGGAARLPTGQLRGVPGMRGDQAVQRSALGEGIIPIGFGRYGVNLHTDVELAVIGASARLSYRHEWLVEDGINRKVWLVSPSFMLGKAYDRESEPEAARGGLRSSVEVPLFYSVDFGGVYETWVGPRLGLEYIRGDFSTDSGVSSVDASGLRAGAVLGFAAGFRRIHAMIELGAAWEQWWVRSDGERRQRGGVVLIPAFALRVRL